MTEMLVHGTLQWKPEDRLRRTLVLRYRPQFKGQTAVPDQGIDGQRPLYPCQRDRGATHLEKDGCGLRLLAPTPIGRPTSGQARWRPCQRPRIL